MPMRRQSKGSRYRMHDYLRQLCNSYNQGIFKVHPKQPSELEETIENELKERELVQNRSPTMVPSTRYLEKPSGGYAP